MYYTHVNPVLRFLLAVIVSANNRSIICVACGGGRQRGTCRDESVSGR